MRFQGGEKPGGGGFASSHVAGHIAGIPETEPEGEVNDSMGSIHPADTMDTNPDKDPEAGGKGKGPKQAE